jgi:hypothetical protein
MSIDEKDPVIQSIYKRLAFVEKRVGPEPTEDAPAIEEAAPSQDAAPVSAKRGRPAKVKPDVVLAAETENPTANNPDTAPVGVPPDNAPASADAPTSPPAAA